jgi:hypothetical protein
MTIDMLIEIQQNIEQAAYIQCKAQGSINSNMLTVHLGK